MTNKAFTLIETMISLFLLAILVLMLTLVLTTTSKISTNFLDFTNYEYSLMHKKILELYESSEKVEKDYNYLTFYRKNSKDKTRIFFKNNRIYMQKKLEGEWDYSGYILLLQHNKNCSLEVYNQFVYIEIVDKSDKVRKFRLKLKDNVKENVDDTENKREES